MIHPSDLRSVKTIVVHANDVDAPCADGRASALILHRALPDARIVEMTYNSRAHRELQPGPGFLFCDFSPWAPQLPEKPTAWDREVRALAFRRWADHGAIVLDHHDPEIVAHFGDRGVWGDNKRAESGAMLAWREVHNALRPSTRVDEAHALAELVAIRDTWQRNDPRWEHACQVSMALAWPTLPSLLVMHPEAVFTLADFVGPFLRARKMDASKAAADAAVRVVARDGLRVAIIPSAGLTSDVADVLASDERTDLVAGFEYVHDVGQPPVLQWSLRSRGSVNVRAIAKRHGGNGHISAAGFRVPDDGRSPYARAAELLCVPEEG